MAARGARLLTIMGSGETAPGMASVHTRLLQRLGAGATAVMLDTPYGFQENADELTARAQEFFAHRVGTPIEVASLRNASKANTRELSLFAERIAAAQYVFAGPGSPSYAMRQWGTTDLAALLATKLREGGCVTLASAAACCAGRATLPVYDIYKTGSDLHWLPGLGLTDALGQPVIVVPHFDNREGGTHDTRYCYMGERRLQQLEAMLEGGSSILGVDEHTAAIIDLDAMTLEVVGRGRVVHRHDGTEVAVTKGAVVELADVFAGHASLTGTTPVPAPDATPARLPEATVLAEHAEAALLHHDLDAAVDAVLEFEALLATWSQPEARSDAHDDARQRFRELLVQLGRVADTGADMHQRMDPLVRGMLAARAAARQEGRFGDADRFRDLLEASGIEVRDTRDGVDWLLRDSPAVERISS